MAHGESYVLQQKSKAHEVSDEMEGLGVSLQSRVQMSLEKTNYGQKDGSKDRKKWQIFKSECQRDRYWASQKFIDVICKR